MGIIKNNWSWTIAKSRFPQITSTNNQIQPNKQLFVNLMSKTKTLT